ncbi:Cysteine proteinase inhibitor [Rhynchospora pubera]|uniref:Cysteine proteinase inhibitor n=1 Tax=Rhynchospora pubera TaxID=906938 RepID=A0AAV8HKB5_9POAL|nr:Cysteine proteinase inhibitor [Rhynchospora pubera]
MKLLFIMLSLLLISLSFHVPSSHSAGGWQPIENITDPHVQEIGNYAVSEHNRQSGDNLEFLRVTSGETQVVAGTNYRLVLEASDEEGNAACYQAVVWEKAWEGFRQLTSFNSV